MELSCPACDRLVHTDELKRLAERAGASQQSGNVSDALAAWRSALELFPPESQQYKQIQEKVSTLSLDLRETPYSGGALRKPAVQRGRWGVIGAVGSVLLFILGKAKFLLLGLSKLSTFSSMLLFLGVYWAAFGWKLAVGIVLSIYIHEMGHVAALVHYGIPATAPMFIPGFGALIRLKQNPTDVREDARIGLAGPLWGLGAAVASYVLFFATGQPVFAAIARLGGLVNLFNLMPVWSLDGARGFRSLCRPHRWVVVLTLGLMYYLTNEGFLLLILIFAGVRALTTETCKPDRNVLLMFLFLVVALSGMSIISVPHQQ